MNFVQSEQGIVWMYYIYTWVPTCGSFKDAVSISDYMYNVEWMVGWEVCSEVSGLGLFWRIIAAFNWIDWGKLRKNYRFLNRTSNLKPPEWKSEVLPGRRSLTCSIISFSWIDWGKPRKLSVRMVGVPTTSAVQVRNLLVWAQLGGFVCV